MFVTDDVTYVIRVKLAVPTEFEDQALYVGLEDVVQFLAVLLVERLGQAVPEVERYVSHLKHNNQHTYYHKTH